MFEDLRRQGYIRSRVNGQIINLSEDPDLDRNMRHTIDVVTDRLILDADTNTRIFEAIESALGLSDGTVIIQIEEEHKVV